LIFGLIQGAVIVLASMLLMALRRTAVEQLAPNRNVLQGNRDYTPAETIKSPVFWVRDVRVSRIRRARRRSAARFDCQGLLYRQFPVTIFGITAVALTYALSLNNIMNGITRPLLRSSPIGSDARRCSGVPPGRHRNFRPDEVWDDADRFRAAFGLVFFAWGEIYSIFPRRAITSDKVRYDELRHAHTAKGTAALLIPFASIVTAATGVDDLFIAGAFNIVAAIMAIAVLRPLRRREIEERR
jgi:OFA family oxalate/formate antiporter-like MFS transporter